MIKTSNGILSNQNIAVMLILISFIILFGLLSYFVPYAYDDILFNQLYIEHSNGEKIFSFKILYNYALEIRNTDNGRLANIICGPAIIFIYKWIIAISSGIAFALMFRLMNLAAGISRSRLSYFIILTCFLSFFLLPMRDHIIVFDYILNYVWSSVFILLFIWLLCKAQSGNLSVPGFVGSILVAVLAAWFHEGFSLPVCIGFAFLCVYKKFAFNWQLWVLAIVFGSITIWEVLAPGTLLRANNEFNGYTIVEKIKIALTQFPAVIILFIFMILSLTNKWMGEIRKNLLSNPLTFITTIAAFTGFIISLSIKSQARASWPGELYAFVSLLYILSKTRVSTFRYLKYIAIICYVIICLFMVNVIIWQKRFFDENNEIYKQLTLSDNGTIFYDIIDPKQARWPTLGLATNDLWINNWPIACLSDFLNKPCSVVPTVLKNFNIEKAHSIEGPDGLMEYEGVLIGPEREYEFCREDYFGDVSTYQFTIENQNEPLTIPCLCNRFIMPDGKKYTYIYPLSPICGKIIFGQRVM